MAIKPWNVLKSEYVLEDRWMTVRADTCETDTGFRVAPYYVQESGDWVHVLALNEQHEVLITRQYRHGVGKVMIELPAGCVDPGETPEVAIARELLEETGCQAGTCIQLPSLSPNPARFNNTMHHFVAFDVRHVADPAQDPTEQIEFEFIPIPQLMEMVERGDFAAALHIPTIFMGLARAGLLPQPARG
jgi:ADP-ribose pyrophosphatase